MIKSRGYTVVELLVYAAIVGFVLVFVIGGMVNLNKAVVAVRLSRDLDTSGATAMERMVREARDASSVDTTNSVLRSTPGKLVINTTNASTTGGTMEFYISSGKLVIKQGATVSPLTAGSVSVSSLYFYSSTTTHSTMVRAILTLSATGTQARTFYDSAVLRESYDQ